MIETIAAPEHVAAFRITGTLTAADYDEMIPQIEKRLAEQGTINVYADLTSFKDMTADAVRHDLAYAYRKLGELNRFRRMAVVSDKNWIRFLVPIASRLTGISIRVFPGAERADAMDWVAVSRDRD